MRHGRGHEHAAHWQRLSRSTVASLMVHMSTRWRPSEFPPPANALPRTTATGPRHGPRPNHSLFVCALFPTPPRTLAPPALPSTPLRLSRTHARAHTPSLPLHPSLVLAQQGDVVPLVYGDVTFVYDRVTCIYVSFAGTACDTYTGSVSFDGVV